MNEMESMAGTAERPTPMMTQFLEIKPGWAALISRNCVIIGVGRSAVSVMLAISFMAVL